MLDEAYKHQLEKIENNYKDKLSILKCVEGILTIEGNRVYTQSRYFYKIISLLDDWTYENCKGEFYSIHLIGHKGHIEYTTYCTPETLELLKLRNFDNLEEPSKVETNLMARLEAVFGKGNA